ncbi:predicted protein [Postia placenta Mad-698-R]|nr:predicted protein [Postia placenta Mad-698-R]
MAAAARLLHSLPWLFLAISESARGSPVLTPPLHTLSARGLQVNNYNNGTIKVIDPSSGASIAQGSVSDGSGTDFSATAIIWLVYCFAIGASLAFTGIKFPRVTNGAAIGITATACVWAAMINTESSKSLHDLVLTLVPVCLFVPGFIFGLFPYGRLSGVILITIASGFSWGARICLFRSDLLVREVYGDWLIGTAFALMNVVLVPYYERVAVNAMKAIASASVGTFFIGLGVDLIINKQAGMSFGLRLLCDRNKAHYLDLVYKGWKPGTSTIIILAVTLGVVPLLAYAQHRAFPQAYVLPERDINEQYKTRPLPRPAKSGEEKAQPAIAVQEVCRTHSFYRDSVLRDSMYRDSTYRDSMYKDPSIYTVTPPVTRPQSQVMESYF